MWTIWAMGTRNHHCHDMCLPLGFLYSPHCLDGGNKNVWLFFKLSQSLDENIYSWMSISIKGSSLLDSGKFNRVNKIN